MKLTIAIPTYNRNEILKKNLEHLLPQLTTNCRLVIYDNCSDIPVKNTIQYLIEKYNYIDISVVRNKFNVGMTANILKCFENCLDSWLWIIGDDDQVVDGAVTKVLNDIKIHQDSHFITYAWDEDSFKRKKEVITVGIDHFLETFETFGAVLFLSTSVYNFEKVVGSMAYANFFQTSYAPHLVMLFMSLGEDGKCVYSQKQVVNNRSEDTPLSKKWDQIFIYQITILLRLPLSPKTISKLRDRLEQLTRVWTIYHFIYSLAFGNYAKGAINKPTILYNEVVRSFYSLDNRISTRIISKVGYIIIKYPFLFRGVLSKIYKYFKGKNFELENNLRI